MSRLILSGILRQDFARFKHDVDIEPYEGGFVQATGGTISDVQIGGQWYRIHAFKNVGEDTFVVENGGEVDFLIVAGGGGGGDRYGGGGGAGGVLSSFINEDKIKVDFGNYDVIVGGGGSINSSGFNSEFNNIIAYGGGRGNPWKGHGFNGGSGGGAASDNDYEIWLGGSGTFGQGMNGGNATYYRGGGGGGFLESGQNGVSGGMKGGDGINLSEFFGLNFGENGYFAGGGGGGYRLGTQSGIGGLGGGGGYSKGYSNGMPNTGGGGSAANSDYSIPRGTGGSGIVLVRYEIPDPEYVVATGGTISDVQIGGQWYRIHAFTNVGSHTLNVTQGGNVDVLVVGGGGGGDAYPPGGAGGLRFNNNYNLSEGEIEVIVGVGGSGGYYNGGPAATVGGNSKFDTIISAGGGAGGDEASSNNGGSGGAPRSSGPGGSGNVPSTDPPQGHNSGNRITHTGSSEFPGGGGAGEPGQDSRSQSTSKGGDGLYFGNYFTDNYGDGGWFAGGGGSGINNSHYSGDGGPGGQGGGGQGGRGSGTSLIYHAESGLPNTGGGGGGGGRSTFIGGNGGSGIVLVRYRISDDDVSSLVTNGLIFHLDASNQNSFRGVPTTNLISTSNMESYSLGFTGNVCGFSNNWASRFGSGNFSVQIVQADNSPVPGLSKCQRIQTYASGWGGWTNGTNIGGTSGNVVYGVWIRLWYGEIQFGNLNSSHRLYITTDTSQSSNPAYDVVEPGQWVYVARRFDGSSGGRHLYANGITFADILAVQIENQPSPTPYVSGSRGLTYASGGGWGDLSGNGNHVNFYNSVSFISENGGLIRFNGSNQWARTNSTLNLSSYNSITVEIDLKVRDTNSPSGMAFEHSSNWNTNSMAFGMLPNSDGGTTYASNSHHTNNRDGSGPVDYDGLIGTNLRVHTNIWSKISDSTGRQSYIDGEKRGFNRGNEATGSYPNFRNDHFYISCRGGSSIFARHDVYAVRIYGRKLSPEEIKRNYNYTKRKYF